MPHLSKSGLNHVFSATICERFSLPPPAMWLGCAEFGKCDFVHFHTDLDWNRVGKIGYAFGLLFAVAIKCCKFNWLIEWYAGKPKPEEGMEAGVYAFDSGVTLR